MKPLRSVSTTIISLLIISTACSFSFYNNAFLTSRKRSTALHESTSINIALTREEGKNDKLHTKLSSINKNIRIHEIPCIEHAKGPDHDKLPSYLTDCNDNYDYIVLTSPEAATVFLDAVKQSDNLCNIACVGKATEKVIQDSGILSHVEVFVPSKANAETIVNELPITANGKNRVLYPASKKAANVIQDGLLKRNIIVDRLDTYDTLPANWSKETLELASTINIICVGSPSAVKSWVHNYNTTDLFTTTYVACIGQTSAIACRELGWHEDCIFYPDKPGLDGWLDSIIDAIHKI